MDTPRSVFFAGSPVAGAEAAMLMIHGRGATAQDILTFVPTLGHAEFTYLAPNAPDSAWYPRPFSAPVRDNEPQLSASLAVIADLVTYLGDSGIPPEHILLFGFLQGACLALEYAVRHPRRYGGVVGLSGGLIGPDDLPRDSQGGFDGTPVFLGCSDVDPYIPRHRVEHAADLFRQMGGTVTARLYPNMAHTVNEDEIAFVRGLLVKVLIP